VSGTAGRIAGLLQAARASAQQGDLQQAEAHYAAIVALDPRHRDALFALGGLAYNAGKFPAAVDFLQRAVAVDRRTPQLHVALGRALLGRGDCRQAQASFRRALHLRPTDAAAHHFLGLALFQDGNLEQAATCLRRALSLKPDFVEAHCDLGVVLEGRGSLDEAIEHYRQALALMPAYAAAHNNVAGALAEKGLYEEALASYERAVTLDPGYAVAHANRAVTLLACGRFEEGWREHEWRWRAGYGGGHAPDPRWPGRELPLPSAIAPLDFAGKRVLCMCDEGLGDELFYLRFAPVAIRRGGRIAHLASPKLASILGRVPGIELVDRGAPIPPDIDHIILASDFPALLGATGAADIPPPLAIAALPQRTEAARRRLAEAGAGPCLGIAWRAGIAGRANGRPRFLKEVPLARLALAVRSWPGVIAIVQREPRAGEIALFTENLGRPVLDFSDANDSLEDMLGVLALLDDYVTPSNTNVHLRAGLGRPSRVLVPHPPEWRWMIAGDASPWYPGCRIYREAAGIGWDVALSDLARDLAGAAGASAIGGDGRYDGTSP